MSLKAARLPFLALGGLAALLLLQLLTPQKLQFWVFQKASGSLYLTKT